MDNETTIQTKRATRTKTSPLSRTTDILKIPVQGPGKKVSEIIFISTYPPRPCGIATYSKDLESALTNKFGDSIKLTICPLESEIEQHQYSDDITYALNTDMGTDYRKLSHRINTNPDIGLVVVQHEFGLFRNSENTFQEFLENLEKPVAITFHTVLPAPTTEHRQKVEQMAAFCDSIIVMTQKSSDILVHQYGVPAEKINVISHGTHLVHYEDKDLLKKKYNLSGKKVLSTFGLLGPGKSIETTLRALPEIVKEFPDTVFLVLGRTHPSLVKTHGEAYRDFLEKEVDELGLRSHVRFINQFLPLEDLLEYLQLTDIYLFTSNDPNQAVSGTFVYALSCGCPVISTPIPHALEVLQNEAGVVFDFEDSDHLRRTVLDLLRDEKTQNRMSRNGLQTSAASAWENAAIAHGKVFEKTSNGEIRLKYRKPPIDINHIKKMTTDVGIIQFSNFNQPDIESGYTLDDNARALIALCRHYELTGDESDLQYIKLYSDFIYQCFRPDGKFLNYVDKERRFTDQNDIVNLDDAYGRAIWALGYLLSMSYQLPEDYESIEDKALFLFQEAFQGMDQIRSPRGMAFIIKGLFFYKQGGHDIYVNPLVKKFADRLIDVYRHESTDRWEWFERDLTYGNSVLPHALLMAYMMTHDQTYQNVAKESFDFLLSKIFIDDTIRVISNQNWLNKEDPFDPLFKGGEQPIDVAYTVLALKMFHLVFPEEGYDQKMIQAFNWFLGENPLQQIIYNPCTSGCYDGLELNNVNLNQGAESTLSYLLARMAFENLPLQ